MNLLIGLFKVFGAFMAVVLVWDRLTRKYLNPYKLFLVFGKKGSGKSTYLVKLAQQHLKKGWHVYTNMEELFMPGVRHFDIEHLGEFVPEARSLLLLDEVGMIWDARDYKVFKPEVRDFFKLQRHYHVKVYMASQTFDVDKKLRDLCDGMFLHTNFARTFTLGKRISRKIVLTESTSEAESRISENLCILPFWYWTFTYIPRWAKCFDSHAVPNKPILVYREDEPMNNTHPSGGSGIKIPVKAALRILRVPFYEDVKSADDIPKKSPFGRFRAYRVSAGAPSAAPAPSASPVEDDFPDLPF